MSISQKSQKLTGAMPQKINSDTEESKEHPQVKKVAQTQT
jgi:hypothetical protein